MPCKAPRVSLRYLITGCVAVLALIVVQDHKWVQPTPAWSAMRISDFGYGHMTFFNATHLHYEFEHTDSRKVVDDFWVVKT